jgi:glycerol-3-phosphate cytidylyltransferase-like family protein
MNLRSGIVKRPKWCYNASIAREYISNHEIIKKMEIDIINMSDERILEFANDIYQQFELVTSKYILKQISNIIRSMKNRRI